MKSFFKNVLANIVAILFLGGITTLFFILFLAIGSLTGDSKVRIKNNSVLVLDGKMKIIDSPSEDQEDLFSFGNHGNNVLLYDVLEAIKKAKSDEKIKGISIESDFINAGMTQLDDVRNALEDFKKSGKFVYAYGNVVSQPSYFLGSVANQYYLNPSGGIDLKGLSTEIVYLKNFAEKFGIGVEVIRHGKFKAAVEPFLRDDMSPENKEQMETLLGDIWKINSAKIAKSRKMDSASLGTTIDSLYGMIPDLAVQRKLADKLIQKSEYENLIKSKIKTDPDKDLNKVSFSKYIRSIDEENKKSDDHIAVLYASGAINNGEGYDEIYAENYVKEIKKLSENKKVKAVVLRINSPGGSANASDEILFELQELKKKKPLIVSFGDYAASGGYYIAMGADKIYSEPNTITGSIGVFGLMYYFKDIANKNGISAHGVSTNANSNYYSPINGITEGGKNIIQKSIEGTYKRFVYFVTQNRKKTFEQIDEVGSGRVWSGTRAKNLGLVDELGTLNDAINYAAKKVGMKEQNVASYPQKRSKFEEFFGNMNEDDISAKIIKNKVGKENFKIYEMMSNPNQQNQVMMELPFTIKY